MIAGLLGKLLAGKLLGKIGKIILINLLRELAKQSDNTIDDKIVADIEAAL